MAALCGMVLFLIIKIVTCEWPKSHVNLSLTEKMHLTNDVILLSIAPNTWGQPSALQPALS